MNYRLLRESTPRAAKNHRCIWCGEVILKGSRYYHEEAIFEGEFHGGKWHNECIDAMSGLIEEQGGPVEYEPHGNPRGGIPECLI